MNAMNKGSKAGNESKDEVISGDIDFPKQWTVFAPLERSGPPLPRETLDAEQIAGKTGNKTGRGHRIAPDFRGPNIRPEACASKLAIQDVLDAVEYAKKNARTEYKARSPINFLSAAKGDKRQCNIAPG